MSFGNRSAQDQPDTGATAFGRVEWNEEVRRFNQPRSVIFDPHIQLAAVNVPRHPDATTGLHGSINRVAEDVDHQLIELVAIGLNADRWTGFDRDRQTGFEIDRPPNPCANVQWFEPGRRKSSEPSIRLHESHECLGPCPDHVETLRQIFIPVSWAGLAIELGSQSLGE